MADDDVRRRRLQAQRLIQPPTGCPAETVRAVMAIQAQDRRAAPLAVRARTRDVSAEAVEGALRSGAVVRTWAMRGTLHLLAAEDVPLALAVFAPVLLRRARRRLAQLALPPAVADRGAEEAAAALAEEGPLTRHELADRLRARGVPVPAEGQAPIWMVYRAALAGVLCEVGVRGREELYGRIDLGPLPDRDSALAALARRYAAAHDPAGADDFGAWSGLPAADVRRGWVATSSGPPAADVRPCETATVLGRGRMANPGQDGFDAARAVRLLPAFDEWLLGWRSRDFTLPPGHARRVAPGGGIVRPVAIADGRVFATWRLDRPRRRIEVAPFERLPSGARQGLEEETASIGAFLGADLALHVAA